MSFAPVLIASGYAGWSFLKRTAGTQQAAQTKSPALARDVDYFRAKIGQVKTADDLVADRRLLKVALGAFGLDADLDAKAFVRKILADGTLKTTALANKLADKQYVRFSAAFGFGDFDVPRTQLSTFADEIISAYTARQFESAVGAQDGDLRLALFAQRELPALAAKSSTDKTKWFSVMGSPPLRQVMQAALGLPASVAKLDVDQQLSLFQDRARRIFGADGVSQFADPAKLETLIQRFLVKSQADQALQQSGGLAVSMLGQTSAMMRSWRF